MFLDFCVFVNHFIFVELRTPETTVGKNLNWTQKRERKRTRDGKIKSETSLKCISAGLKAQFKHVSNNTAEAVWRIGG